MVTYAAGRARSVAKHVDIVKDDQETTVQASDVEWVLSLLDRYGSGGTVSEEEIDRALLVTNALPMSVWSEDGVEAANIIWHAVECMAAVARHPEDTRTFLKWAVDSAVVSHVHLDSTVMTEEAWEDYDHLLNEGRL